MSGDQHVVALKTPRVDQLLRMFNFEFHFILKEHRHRVNHNDSYRNGATSTTYWFITKDGHLRRRTRENFQTGLWYFLVTSFDDPKKLPQIMTTEEGAMDEDVDIEVWSDM